MSNSDFEGSAGDSQRLQPIEPNFNNHLRQDSTRSYVSEAHALNERSAVQRITQKNAEFSPMKYYFRLPNCNLSTANGAILAGQALMLALLVSLVLFV